MINEFRRENYFLSNFFETPGQIEFEGYTYTSGEAAFHAQKNDSATYKHLMQFLNPSQAKKEGRSVLLRADWDSVKEDIMYRVVKAKFEQNEILKAKLLATGSEYLREGNIWHDNYWGVCTCDGSRCRDRVGRNRLGLILMKVRQELKSNAL